jgi:hypothetical protein
MKALADMATANAIGIATASRVDSPKKKISPVFR